MPADSESYGEPHTLTAYFDGDDELTYDIEHPPSCTKKVYTYEFACAGGESPTVEEWDCDVYWHETESGLFESLEYSGTPVTEPGTYRIQGWSRKTYYPLRGYEHDAGVGLIGDEEEAPMSDREALAALQNLDERDEPGPGYWEVGDY